MTESDKREDIKKLGKDTAILLGITIVAGLVLGFVYNLTKEPIAFQQERKVQMACANVYEEAQTFEEWNLVPTQKTENAIREAGYEGTDIGTVYAAKGEGETVLGYVITVTSHEGYGGDITFLMGVSLDGTVTGMSILNISETAGLGMNAQKILAPQFEDKNAAAFEYTKTGATAENQIDAISGATITTKAVTNGVNAGLIFFREDLKQGGTE